MTDEHNKSEHEIENPETRYERRDMSPQGVLLFLAGLAVVSVLIYFMLWGFYGYLNGFKQGRAEVPSPLETAHDNANTQKVIQSFPEPRLQANEPADLNKFKAQQEQILNSYGWVDQQAGIAHIPVEQAIDILAAHGLPVREQQTPPAAGQAQAKPSGGQ